MPDGVTEEDYRHLTCPKCRSKNCECQAKPHVHRCLDCGFDGTRVPDRMLFDGFQSYYRIWEWMRECGHTSAADGFIFDTPNVRWPGQVARPGDWIVRTEYGFVAEPSRQGLSSELADRLAVIIEYIEGADRLGLGLPTEYARELVVMVGG